MDADLLHAGADQRAQRAGRLVADEQDRRVGAPEMILEVMLDPPGIAHAGAGQHDRPAMQPADRLALLHRLGEAERTGAEGMAVIGPRQGRAMTQEDFRRPPRKRRVEKHRGVHQRAVALQRRDVVEDFLGPFDREHRHDDIAAGGEPLGEFPSQDRPALALRVALAHRVAVGRFDQRDVCRRRPGRIGLQGLFERPEIAGKDQPDRRRIGIDLQFDESAAENVPGVAQARPHAGHRLEPCLVGHRVQEIEGGLGIGLGVDRRHGGLGAARVAPVQPLDVVLLDGAGVGQQPVQQVGRRRRRPGPPAEAGERQLGEQAGVVDVGMGEQHGGDTGGVEGKRAVVQRAQRLRSLEHAAVDQQLAPRRDQPVTRAGDGSGRAVGMQRYGHEAPASVTPSPSAANFDANRKSASKAAWMR